MAQVTTLSSIGTSGVIVLDPKAKSTTVMLSASASSSANLTIQATLDDPSAVPAPTLTWAAISSAISSSAAEGVGVMYTVVSPLGGVRLNSTAVSATTTVTLKALQSVTA
jgi:hypothetical protein